MARPSVLLVACAACLVPLLVAGQQDGGGVPIQELPQFRQALFTAFGMINMRLSAAARRSCNWQRSPAGYQPCRLIVPPLVSAEPCSPPYPRRTLQRGPGVRAL